MEFNIKNAFQIFSMIPSLILSTFFILLSLFNGDIKAFVFLIGVFMALIINQIVSKFTKTEPKIDRNSLYCDAFSIPFLTGNYISPYSTSVFLGFTFLYMLMPMNYNNQMNPSLLITLGALILLSGKSALDYSCATFSGITVGVLLGALLGWAWFVMLISLDAGEHLYFGEVMSDRATCKSKKTTFKCVKRSNNM